MCLFIVSYNAALQEALDKEQTQRKYQSNFKRFILKFQNLNNTVIIFYMRYLTVQFGMNYYISKYFKHGVVR